MIEFNVGDRVTFNAYGEDVPARVVAAGVANPMFCPNDGIWYELTGTDRRKPLISKCTGQHIKESILFEEAEV